MKAFYQFSCLFSILILCKKIKVPYHLVLVHKGLYLLQEIEQIEFGLEQRIEFNPNWYTAGTDFLGWLGVSYNWLAFKYLSCHLFSKLNYQIRISYSAIWWSGISFLQGNWINLCNLNEHFLAIFPLEKWVDGQFKLNCDRNIGRDPLQHLSFWHMLVIANSK